MARPPLSRTDRLTQSEIDTLRADRRASLARMQSKLRGEKPPAWAVEKDEPLLAISRSERLSEEEFRALQEDSLNLQRKLDRLHPNSPVRNLAEERRRQQSPPPTDPTIPD